MRIPKKYFVACLFENGIEAGVSRDGLIYIFEPKDIVGYLEAYPRGVDGWYFNESRDRLCAEDEVGWISVNPAIVQKLIGLPIAFNE